MSWFQADGAKQIGTDSLYCICFFPPDFSVHEILQARILEWVAIPFSRWMKVDGKSPAPSISCLHHLQTLYIYWGMLTGDQGSK